MEAVSCKLDFKERLASGLVACWKSPANIALIKYWGKKGFQIPANASLSFSLNEAYTITRIRATLNTKENAPAVSFIFEGERNTLFAGKIEKFLQYLKPYLTFLSYASLEIESGNNFPHSAGIASSASGMSALALCLCSIEAQLANEEMSEEAFLKRASFIARLGSGSACRSLYGGYSVWGVHDAYKHSSDEYAIPLDFQPSEMYLNINDSILLVDQTPKKVSSRAGHALMDNHPYALSRFAQAYNNMKELKLCLQGEDWDHFASIVENEALSLHAMMMCSQPGYILLHPDTLNIINRLIELRKQKHAKVCFTLDAGPNIHLLYPYEEFDKVSSIINELENYCFDNRIIHDKIGSGPEIKHCK